MHIDDEIIKKLEWQRTEKEAQRRRYHWKVRDRVGLLLAETPEGRAAITDIWQTAQRWMRLYDGLEESQAGERRSR